MKTQKFLISYIVLNSIPADKWADLPYRKKKEFHYIVTVSGKKIPMKPVQAPAGSIEVVFVGSDHYAKESEALFSMLADLSAAHPAAKIVKVEDLYNGSRSQPFVTASQWLMQHMPPWLRRKLLGPRHHPVFTPVFPTH